MGKGMGGQLGERDMRKCVILFVGLMLVMGRIAVAGPPQRHAVIVGIAPNSG